MSKFEDRIVALRAGVRKQQANRENLVSCYPLACLFICSEVGYWNGCRVSSVGHSFGIEQNHCHVGLIFPWMSPCRNPVFDERNPSKVHSAFVLCWVIVLLVKSHVDDLWLGIGAMIPSRVNHMSRSHQNEIAG